MRVFLTGGAGFIGSHTVAKLLSDPTVSEVTVYDNFSSGKREFLPRDEPRLNIVKADISSLERLSEAIEGHDLVFHYASNPDIARAAREPDIDFWQGTFLTQNVLEAMRRTGVKEIVYSSGSGIYGDAEFQMLGENHSPLLPVSTYGASKLAGESLICSYCYMFGLRAWVFRFANVVGPRQTHGVTVDFIRKLADRPSELTILGDGLQSKSYIHVDDVLSAIWCGRKSAGDTYNYFNVSTDDNITVNEIADIVINIMGLGNVRRIYAGGNRGWKGDVPVVRLDATKIGKLGWQATRSTHQAIRASAQALHDEFAAVLSASVPAATH